jgi:hypothetical protein
MANANAARKRVFIYVPFSEDHTGTSADAGNPNHSAGNWAAVRNASPKQSARKEYIHLAGPDAFHATAFQPSDRIYVHAHGGDWGEIFARGGRTTGKEKAGVDKHTPTSLWKNMNENPTFAALGTSAASPLDLRIAACHSADHGSFNAQLKTLKEVRGRHVALKGKEGEFSANTGSMTRSGVGRPSSKGLIET